MSLLAGLSQQGDSIAAHNADAAAHASTRIGATIRRTLDRADRSLALSIVGHSVTAGTGRWPKLLCDKIAAAYPNWSVWHWAYDNTATCFNAPVVIQTGSLGQRYYAPATDSLTYVENTEWGDMTGIVDAAVWVSGSDWTTSQSLCSKYYTAEKSSWIFRLQSGKPRFGWYNSSNAYTEATSSVAVTQPAANAVVGLRCVFDPAGTAKFRVSYDNGATWTAIGTTQSFAATDIRASTAQYRCGALGGNINPWLGKMYRCDIRDGENGPLLSPPTLSDWHIPSLTAGVFGGSPTLNIFNGAISGNSLASYTDPLIAKTHQKGTLATFCMLGHNEGTDDPVTFFENYAAYNTRRIAWQTQVPLVLISDTPKVQSRNFCAAAHASRQIRVPQWATFKGFECWDFFADFLALSGWEDLVQSDGTHPTEPAGQQAIATIAAAKLGI